jgi:aspartate/methionine/tyrosine aminotransferase
MTETFGNPLLGSIGPSVIRAMYERRRDTSIDLSMGQPTLAPDMQPFGEAMDWIRDNGAPYAPNAGLPELREAIARIYGAKDHLAANACVTNGSQEGIYLAVKSLLDPKRDRVLLTDPTYPSYARCCELEGIEHTDVRLDAANGFAIEADALLEAIGPKTRMIVLGSPANPTGAVMATSQLRKLADGLQTRKGPPVWVVVDEVYRELSFTGEPYTSLLQLYPHTVALHSLSKCCALTGMRIGFALGPEAAIGAMARAHALMLMSVNVFAQHVALAIVRQPDRLRAHYDWYAKQRRLVVDTAVAHKLPIVEPQGAFYALLALPERWSDSQVAADHVLDRYDVVTVPGRIFGKTTERYLRLSWSAQPADVAQGLARLAEFCSSGAS